MKLTFSDNSDYTNTVLRGFSDLSEGVGTLGKRISNKNEQCLKDFRS